VQHLDQIITDIQAHLNTSEVFQVGNRRYRPPVAAITCRDGTVFSIQAGEGLYCTPRSNTGPWTHVEVMTVTNDATPRNWEQDECKIGAWVPIEAVAREILERGYLSLTA
jgi:hypothetical protein